MMFPTMKNSVLAMTVLAALSSCGSQSFDVVQSQENSGTAGSQTIAPKIDIVLAVDNSGSTLEINTALNNSIRTFLTSINGQNWDFRVTAIPLTGTAVFGKVSASKFDANSPNWVAPYPGAQKTSTIPASRYVQPGSYSTGITAGNVASEPGLNNIADFLNNATVKNEFVRADAALAVIVIGNGDDSSWAPAGGGCYPGQVYYPGTTTPCETQAQKDANLQTLIGRIVNSKGSSLANTVHLFPVVGNGGSCYGERSLGAPRYIMAGSSIGGHSPINLCSGSMSTVLTGQIQSGLSAIQLNFVKNFITISNAPDANSVTVTKNLANGAKITVPASNGSSPGWIYRGYISTNTVIYPISMDPRTGHMIELIGSEYMLSGSETATVEYSVAGVRASQ